MQFGTNVDKTESEFEPSLGSVTRWVSSLDPKDVVLFILSIVNDLALYHVLVETFQNFLSIRLKLFKMTANI